MAKAQSKAQSDKALLSQGDAERYRHFIERAAELKTVWGLFRDGWALSRDGEGRTSFPLWPSTALAEACALDSWDGFVAEPIPVEDLVDQLLPQLAKDGLDVAVFPLPRGRAPLAPLAQLIFDLERALGREGEEDD